MTTKTWLDQSPPSDHKRVIVNKLTNGQNSAIKLQSLLRNLGDGSMTSTARWEELVMEIETSFTQSLSVLSESRLLMLCDGDDRQCSNGGGGVDVKAEQSHVEHSHCGNRGFEDSGESKKRLGTKDRRGCYKRRKNSESWTTVTSTIEDGQAWRKYGQKEILNATYPRAYFRCTRKNDQGCQATKQVQQTQDSPKLYKTTYIGNHSCTIITIPQMIIGASNSPALASHGAPPLATSISESESIFPVKKEESLTSSGVTDNVNDTSDMWPEFDFDLPEAETNVISDEDVVSNMQFLEMHLVKSIGDFDSEVDLFDQIAFPLGP